MQLSDYYFVKCFGKQSYRDTFNSGELFFGHVKEYWGAENAFQQDFEGRILHQEGNGLLIAAKPGFESVLKQARSVHDIEGIVKERGDTIIARTTSASSWINGYICCFYLLPKRNVILQNDKMVFATDSMENKFKVFLANYIGDKRVVFAGIYDAARLCKAVEEVCTNQGVPFARDMVKYADTDTTLVFSCINRGDISPIIFTKRKVYSYQQEYRMFIAPPKESAAENYRLKGVAVASCIVATFEYPS